MRKGNQAFLLLLYLVPFAALGQAPASDGDAFIRRHQYDLIDVTWTRLDDYAVTRVFAHPIYRVSVVPKEGFGQANYLNNLIVARWNDEVIPLPRPSRDSDIGRLLTLVNPDFKLTNDDFAEIFERALDLIYATRQDEEWGEKFHHEGNQWTFVRGRYFGPSGPEDIVVTVDGQGGLTAIQSVRRAKTQ